MYSITVSASRLSAYRSESASFSATRQTRYFLSQKAAPSKEHSLRFRPGPDCFHAGAAWGYGFSRGASKAFRPQESIALKILGVINSGGERFLKLTRYFRGDYLPEVSFTNELATLYSNIVVRRGLAHPDHCHDGTPQTPVVDRG